jgi:hypothetical protein
MRPFNIFLGSQKLYNSRLFPATGDSCHVSVLNRNGRLGSASEHTSNATWRLRRTETSGMLNGSVLQACNTAVELTEEFCNPASEDHDLSVERIRMRSLPLQISSSISASTTRSESSMSGSQHLKRNAILVRTQSSPVRPLVEFINLDRHPNILVKAATFVRARTLPLELRIIVLPK